MTYPPVQRYITVNGPVDKVFQLFTEQMHSWWPPAHRLGSAERAAITLEPRVGGRWGERGVDGSECEWGRVLAYEPPVRLLLSWQIDGSFRPDPDPEHASEVEVTFTDVGGRTHVNLEHRFFERHGPTAAAARESVDAPGGWCLIIEQFSKVAETT